MICVRVKAERGQGEREGKLVSPAGVRVPLRRAATASVCGMSGQRLTCPAL